MYKLCCHRKSFCPCNFVYLRGCELMKRFNPWCARFRCFFITSCDILLCCYYYYIFFCHNEFYYHIHIKRMQRYVFFGCPQFAKDFQRPPRNFYEKKCLRDIPDYCKTPAQEPGGLQKLPFTWQPARARAAKAGKNAPSVSVQSAFVQDTICRNYYILYFFTCNIQLK